MSFKFTVTNLPAGATYWAATFWINGKEYWLGNAKKPGDYETFPVAGNVDNFTIGLYKSDFSSLAGMGKTIYYGNIIADGHSYQFDFTTNQFNTMDEKPAFSNLNMGMYGSGTSIYCAVDFDYIGGDRIGNTTVRMSIGNAGLLSIFNVVGGMEWDKLINLSSNTHHYKPVFQVEVPAGTPAGVYDLRIQIGDSPWDKTVYASKTLADVVTVGEAPVKLPPVPVPDKGSGTREDKDETKKSVESNTVMYVLIGAIALAAFVAWRK